MPPKTKPKLADTQNWYNVIDKKYLTKVHNPNFDKGTCHGIKLPFRAIIMGNSGAGKTQLFLTLLHTMPETFEKIIIVTKNKDEPLYNWLEDKLKEKGLKIVEGLDNLPAVDSFSKEENSLVVLDDLCLESSKAQQPVCDFYIRARKRGCSIIYISQSYFKIPKVIRLNLTYIFIKQLSSMRELGDLMRDYSLGLDKDVAKIIYKTATRVKEDFLMIDLECEPEKRYRKNFQEIFEIPEEGMDDKGINLIAR